MWLACRSCSCCCGFVGQRQQLLLLQEQLIQAFQDLLKKGALSTTGTEDALQLLVSATDHHLRIFGAA